VTDDNMAPETAPRTADGLREAAVRVVLEWDEWEAQHGKREYVGREVERLRAALAATPAPLDVERLARALSALDTGPDGMEYSHTYAVDSPEAFAAAIARAYAEDN
jgi:hypothetical protein